MLKTRILTALVLFAGFIAALLYLPPVLWAIFSGIIIVAAAWEWGGLMKQAGKQRLPLVFTILMACFLFYFLSGDSPNLQWNFNVLAIYSVGEALNFSEIVFFIAGLFWLLLMPFYLKRQSTLWDKPAIGFVCGLIVLFPTWLALVALRGFGVNYLLFILAIPWIADMGAFFVGRKFGKTKLAPNISPNKTKEGAIGGAFAVLLFGSFVFFVVLKYELNWISFAFLLVLFVFLIVLTIASICGDLFESLLKRQAGVKDSGNFLPGHGGILDRIDSLTSTLPLAAFLIVLFRFL